MFMCKTRLYILQHKWMLCIYIYIYIYITHLSSFRHLILRFPTEKVTWSETNPWHQEIEPPADRLPWYLISKASLASYSLLSWFQPRRALKTSIYYTLGTTLHRSIYNLHLHLLGAASHSSDFILSRLKSFFLRNYF